MLKHGDRTVWESIAIIEYLAELFPQARLWPEDIEARAIARSVSAEMHAGFQALRANMPMNVRASLPDRGRTPEVEADIQRIAEIWRDCRKRFGSGGPFLFGTFSNADAMFAPVVTCFNTYAVDLDDVGRAYMDTVLAWPAVIEWFDAARAEPWRIERYDSA